MDYLNKFVDDSGTIAYQPFNLSRGSSAAFVRGTAVADVSVQRSLGNLLIRRQLLFHGVRAGCGEQTPLFLCESLRETSLLHRLQDIHQTNLNLRKPGAIGRGGMSLLCESRSGLRSEEHLPAETRARELS